MLSRMSCHFRLRKRIRVLCVCFTAAASINLAVLFIFEIIIAEV